MHVLLLTALLQTAPQQPTERQILEAEHARHDSSGVLARAAASGDPRLQRLAIRALGRFERPEHAAQVARHVAAADPSVRREAINALGQMRARFDLVPLLATERDDSVRGAIYETIGRVAGADSALEAMLATGLGESAVARSGAARGIESYVRRNVRTKRPAQATVDAMRRAFVADRAAETRQLLLLALNAAGDRDSVLLAGALRDSSAQVRRLAVMGSRQWIHDPSPIVRYQALRVAGTCERAVAALADSSEHVALAAVDLLGELKCDAAVIELAVQSGRTWRLQARALVSLAPVAPAAVATHMPRFRSHTQWQARAYAAAAARIIGDSVTLSTLSRDRDPNVAAAALHTVDDVRRALGGMHAGLMLDALAWVQRENAVGTVVPELTDALRRTTATGNITYRDVRVAMLDRLAELTDDSSAVPLLRTMLGDIDPEVALRAARIVSARSGTTVVPRTTVFRPAPLPSAEFIAGLRGARAVIQFRNQGAVTLELLPDDATVTVAVFAQLADAGRFNGLSIHRIVPNFVIQGASPGANEYDGLTTHFMRDELGFARNARGTFGISTRGRDTGDGQIYVNLVDNVRLDHDYTVFARIVEGMSVIDRIQEGDVIDTVRIVRGPDRPGPASQAVSVDTATPVAARSPAFSSDGRLVVAVDGDLMLQSARGAPLQRLTSGLPWDRDPSFSRDGRAILFASDRGGNYDIYRLPVAADGTPGVIERLTTSAAPDLSPADLGDRVLFIRGGGASARIWSRDGSGAETRVHSGDVSEQALAASVDGTRYAFVSVTESVRRVVVRSSTGSDSSVANVDRNAERLAFSPDGERLALSTRTGVFIVPRDGRYTNFVSSKRGDVAWSPDGSTLAIAENDDVTVGYNGDPDRQLDRSASERFGGSDRLFFVAAPVSPDHALTAQAIVSPTTRRERNAVAFDRVWERSAQLYFASSDATARRAQWESARNALRPRALAAANDEELQQVTYDLLRRRPPLRIEASGKSAVSSAHPVATDAGLEILRAGGNVVDAAVAVSFALGVVEPDASGIGGYGQMVIALSSLAKPTLIEFMSRVPEEAALSNTSLLQNGRYPSDGPVLANVPGTVAGMYDAWRKYGSKRVSWARLVEPAIRAARDGYVVSDGLATTLATEREHFAKYEGSRALFFRNGVPLVAGDTLRNPDLAWVLEQIARDGADGFYRGDVARKYVDDLRARGNAMKASDLARYFAPERAAVSGSYRGYTIYSSAPPVSGGAELVGRLNLLEHFPAPKLYTEDATTLHAVLSAWFLVPPTRGRIADPALWPVDVAPIIDRDSARARWRCFDELRALRPADLRGDRLACAQDKTTPSRSAAPAANVRDSMDVDHAPCGEDHAREQLTCHASGTTAFTVADNDGNAVSVTQTLGTWGGNFYVTPGLGFLSNDKLTSYGTDPTQYGARLPFARHGSTIAPTVVYKGSRPVFAIGAAGNAWITSAIFQGMIGALDFGLGPQQVLELPRFLPGGGGGGRAGGAGSAAYSIQMEDGFSPKVIARLRQLGYDVSFVSMRGELREGYGAAIRIDGRTVTAGADPRRSGAAGAIK